MTENQKAIQSLLHSAEAFSTAESKPVILALEALVLAVQDQSEAIRGFHTTVAAFYASSEG